MRVCVYAIYCLVTEVSASYQCQIKGLQSCSMQATVDTMQLYQPDIVMALEDCWRLTTHHSLSWWCWTRLDRLWSFVHVRGSGSGSLPVLASCAVALLSGSAWALRGAEDPYQMVERSSCRAAPPHPWARQKLQPPLLLLNSKTQSVWGWC